jgi:ubiquinone/menaquinone biosynthesis C-methylase UbiE
MSIDDPRKAYWNEKYVEYWRSRVNEAGAGASEIIKGDARTEDDEVYEKIFAATPFVPGNLLDVGCAWGRMFPLYHAQKLCVSGVDISAAMIEAAYNQWHGHESIDVIKEASAEKLPFVDNSFDNLVCLATFDATYQNQAMTEFLRVTRPGANIYVTGKNTNYNADDDAAMAAEIGARSKGHPNYFTRTNELISLMLEQGHLLVSEYYFARRGDFAAMRHTIKPDKEYYEYFLIFKRGDTYKALPECSDLYSVTFVNAKDEL